MSNGRKETLSLNELPAMERRAALSGDDDDDGSTTTHREEEGGRMTPLVAALPSTQKNAAKINDNKGKNKNGSKNNNDNNILSTSNRTPKSKKDQTLITTALQTLEKDMAILDNVVSLQPQLSGTEVGLLLGAVVASGIGPIAFPGRSVTEVLAPAAAACECMHAVCFVCFSFVCWPGGFRSGRMVGV